MDLDGEDSYNLIKIYKISTYSKHNKDKTNN
jgi:hypothetical protein